ncbi:MAG: ankyrin repeat domain-containing protein [Cucumibacter sp.]
MNKRTWSLALLVLAASALAACDQSPSGPGGAASPPSEDASAQNTPAGRCTDPPVLTPVRENLAISVRSYTLTGGNLDQFACSGESLIYVATGPRGGISVLRALIEGGADLENGTRDGRTPLMNAVHLCNVAAVRILLEAGADAARAGPAGETMLDLVCAEPADQRAEIVALLETAQAGSE